MIRGFAVPAWLRDPGRHPAVLPFGYAALLIGSEAGLIENHHVLAGGIVDAGLVLILANAVPDPISPTTPRVVDPADAAMRALAVVALCRVIAIGLPLRDASTALATLVVALLVAGATLGTARVVAVPIRAMMKVRAPRLQRQAILAGFVLGLAAYLVGAPRIWAPRASADRVLLALAAAVAAAFTEELLFRGLLLVSLRRVAARGGMLASTAMFTATYLGAGSAALVLVIALAAVVFASVVVRSGSLTGALGGHAVLALCAGGLCPALFGVGHTGLAHSPVATVVLALVLVVLCTRALSAAATSAAAPAPSAVSTPVAAPATTPVAAPATTPVAATATTPVAATAPSAAPTPVTAPAPTAAESAEPEITQESFPHGHAEAVLVCARRLHLPDLLDPMPGPERDLATAAIVQLTLSAGSGADLPLARAMALTTVGMQTGTEGSTPEEVSAALRWLGDRQDQIEARLVARHLPEDDGVPLYDVRVADQGVYGLLSDSTGRPVAVRLHAHPARDPAAIPDAVAELRGRFHLSELIVTCDPDAEAAADLTLLPWTPGWIAAIDPGRDRAAPVRSPDEQRLEIRREPAPVLALRAGGAAVRRGSSRALLSYFDATDPDLRILPPHGVEAGQPRGALTATMLATYLAWHLREAWADLLLEDRRGPDGQPLDSIATVFAALAERKRVIRRRGSEVRVDRLTERTGLQTRALALIMARVHPGPW